jgi:hypothetical protein
VKRCRQLVHVSLQLHGLSTPPRKDPGVTCNEFTLGLNKLLRTVLLHREENRGRIAAIDVADPKSCCNSIDHRPRTVHDGVVYGILERHTQISVVGLTNATKIRQAHVGSSAVNYQVFLANRVQKPGNDRAGYGQERPHILSYRAYLPFLSNLHGIILPPVSLGRTAGITAGIRRNPEQWWI